MAAIPTSLSNFRGIPAPSHPKFQTIMKEIMETGIGHVGTGLDRFVTLRDLTNSGLVKYLNDQGVSVTRPDQGVQDRQDRGFARE